MLYPDNVFVDGVSHRRVLDVDVSRAPAADPVGHHFDGPSVVLTDLAFIVRGRSHRFPHLPQKT